MAITIRKILPAETICLCSIIISATCSSAVWSQNITTSAIEEVVVTAQMREENVQTIPIAIGVYDKKFIARVGASSLTGMETAIPNINFGPGDRNTRGEIVIRGVGDYSRNIGTNARVAVYIDGVLTGRSSTFDQGLLDVAHFEVLRGPQGTLAGTNSIAGAINIITQKPEDSFAAELLTNVGNYDLHSVTGKINVPITSDFFASLLLGSTEQDGYIKNSTLNRDLQGINRDTAKLKFRYVGLEKVVLDVGFDYLNDDVHATNAEALADGMFNGFRTAPAKFDVAHNADEFEQRSLKGTTIQTTYETSSNYNWTSITGIRTNEFSELSEEDYSPLDMAVSIFDEKSDQFSQEFKLASPKGEHGDYVVGVYFLDQDISTERRAVTGVSFPGVPNTFAQTPATAEVQAASVYVHGNYHLSRQWSLTAGVRYVNEDKSIDFSSIDTTGFFINTSHLTGHKVFNELLPKLGINFQLTPETLLYSSIGRGYKSGGWNADFLRTLENFEFNPEYAINYELGAKSALLDNRVIVNASAFVTKFDDFQVFQFIPTASSGTILLLTNAGKVTSQGIELDISTALTENLSFSINAAFTQAKFDEFKNSGEALDYDGNYLPYAPRRAYFVALDYNRSLVGQVEFYGHINYGYTGDYYSHSDNARENSIAERDLANARVGVNLGAYWDVSLWIKNIANKAELRQRSLSFLNVPRGVYSPPRTYGLAINYKID